MTTQPVTIDLGVIGPASHEDDAAHLAASRYHWTAGRTRLWWPAALLSAALVLVVGAAAPSLPWATSHLAVPASSQFTLDRTTLYAIDPPEPGKGRTLTAYRLTDGAVRWRTPWSGGTLPMVWPDLLLRVDPRSGAREASVTALDPATGQPRWTRSGTVVGRSGDRLVLHAGDRLSAYHVRDGSRLASLPSAPGGAFRQVVGDLLLWWGRGSALHAYDLATLTRRWSTGVTGQWRGAVIACGRLLCLSRGDRVLALDPATGRPAWWTGWLTLPGKSRVDLVGGGPEWGERIVVHTSQPTGSRSWLVDTRSGAPLAELPGWRPLRRLHHTLAVPQRETLLTRYLNRATWFAQVRPEPPGIAVLGAIEGTPPHGCRRAGEYLACYSRQLVQVWRMRLP